MHIARCVFFMANIITPPPPTPQQAEEQKRNSSGKHDIKSAISADTAFKYNYDYHKMADFLGVKKDDKMDKDVAEKIAYIRDYTKEKDELDAMVKIRDMIKSLGFQSQGKDLIINLYKYVRLASEREKIDKEIDLITNNGR